MRFKKRETEKEIEDDTHKENTNSNDNDNGLSSSEQFKTNNQIKKMLCFLFYSIAYMMK